MGTESKKGPPKGQGVLDKKAPKEKPPGATQGLKLETDAQGIVGDP